MKDKIVQIEFYGDDFVLLCENLNQVHDTFIKLINKTTRINRKKLLQLFEDTYAGEQIKEIIKSKEEV